MNLVDLSGTLLFVSFIAYMIGMVLFAGAVKGSKNEASASNKRWGKAGITVTILGFLSHLGYFIARWIASGHAPVSNMFEFTTAFGMLLVGAAILFYFMYKTALVGLFALPIAIIILGYAAMFPQDVQPLIPALQSQWLTIHVITAAIGEAILAISAVVGLIYLLKNVDLTRKSKERTWLEFIMYTVIVVVGFIVVSTGFGATGYEAKFSYVDKNGMIMEAVYNNPPLFGMNQYEAQTEGTMEPLAEMPPIINAKTLTTFTWSVIAGTILYVLLRLVTRRRVAELLQPVAMKANSQLMDEIGYRSVLIGFPVFTLGALIFAMIWAHEAWSRFWGWDPKEVWALITWLFYAAYLHLRLSRGWEGKKSAWLAVIGFAIIMFNLIAVNLVIAGLHSYA